MSRKIKFREWNKKGKCWITFGGVNYRYENGTLDIVDSDNLIYEQYTGGEDRNGEEIYEGDIVEEDIDFNSKMTDGTFRYKVYWNEDELCWSLDPIGPESIHNDLWELNSSCRVIGNIHEPPKDFRPEHLKRMGVSISKGGEE